MNVPTNSRQERPDVLAPLRAGMSIKKMIALQDESMRLLYQLKAASGEAERYQLYWQLHHVNAALCQPMPTMQQLNVKPLATRRGGAL